MAGAKSRRQGPSQEKEDIPVNGSAHIEAKDAADDEPRENIFWFWPNIIGRHLPHSPGFDTLPS